MVIILLLAGCQVSVKDTKPPAVSLEEAKKITATFAGSTFTPPPRTINDVTAILRQEKPEDLKSYQQALSLADNEPPAKDNASKLASFYLKRANAAHDVGRARQEIEDYRTALKHGSKSGFKYLKQVMFGLGTAEARSGNYSRGIQYMERAINRGNAPVGKSIYTATLARLYALVGDLNTAKKALDRAENYRTTSTMRRRPDPKYIAQMDSAISSGRGAVLDAVGKLSEGERHRRRAIDRFAPYKDKIMNPGVAKKKSPLIFNWLVAGLAENLRRQGRLVEAEVQARRAVNGALQSHGRYSAHTGMMIGELNMTIFEQGRYAEAEALARANLNIYQKTETAADSVYLADARSILADAVLTQKRWSEALSEYDAIRMAMKTDPAAYKQLIAKKVNLWIALIKGERSSEALPLIQPALVQKNALLGEPHYDTAEIRGILAMALVETGDREAAIAEFSKSVPILLQSASRSESGDETKTAREFRFGLILDAYIQLLISIRGTPLEAKTGIDTTAEAFRLADVARSRKVKQALAASSARAAAKDPALADLARREQDALAQIGALDGLLSNVLSVPSEQQNPETITDLRSRIDRLKSAREALMKEIEARFPDYANFINPKPMSIQETRSNLRPGEALIATYVSDEDSYVWAIPHQGPAAFAATGLSGKNISHMVKALRTSLDPQGPTLGSIPDFDLKTAYGLYESLLKPVETGWKDSKNLLVVAHGALGFLPFSVLPTETVKLTPEKEPLFSNHRNVPWLVRTHSVMALPSVASLRTLRTLPAGDPERKSFTGFGNPYFSLAQVSQVEEKTKVAYVGATRGIAVNRRGLKKIILGQKEPDSAGIGVLTPLPDTADEIRSIALALKADLKRDVFLGKAASEEQVKSMNLSGVKVLAFATHGLLPGELDGLNQPALALSAPEVTRGIDDGLLTMGEILALKLNSDWVVLSACNTGAGEGAGAEAVSGLGRAFFYAGTRALLVSNWPVETTSAKTLTTDLFRHQAADLTLSRSDALNRTMLEMIDRLGYKDATGKMVFSYAHPVFWAPFSLVGDGG